MAVSNPYFTAVEQTLPEYIPLPMQQLMAAGQAVQGRYDQAMDSISQTGTGLASIEALAPAHRQYVSQVANNYRTEISSLLDKYDSDATNPEFLREIKRTNARYSSDPNLGIIRMGNESIKSKQKAIQDIYTKGGRYIDSNPRFTGVDQNGQLTYDAGQVRQTTFETELAKLFEPAAKAIVDDGDRATNRAALDAVVQSISSGANTNPVTLEALQYYAQQGYSQEEAINQLNNDINRLYSANLSDKRVDTNARLAQAERGLAIQGMNAQTSRMRYGLDERKYNDEVAEKAYGNALLPQTSSIEAKNANAAPLQQVDDALRLYDQSGNLKQGKFIVPYNEENLRKYPNAKSTNISAGTGAPGQAFLEITTNQFNAKNKEFVQAAREIVDPSNKLSDRQVLESYKLYLQNDNNAPTFWNTPIKETKDNILRHYAGKNGENLGDAIYVDKNGKSRRVADGDVNLSDFKHFDFAGITSSPVSMRGGTSIENGALKVTAIDSKGNPVIFMKPLDAGLQSITPLSNLVSKTTVSGLNNQQLRTSPEYLREVNGMTIAPQRNNTGGVEFYQIEGGRPVGQPIDPTPFIQQENARVGQFFGTFRNRQ